jgi:choline dehydrogenase-like flavoprotein
MRELKCEVPLTISIHIETVLVIEHGLIDNSSLTLVPRLGLQYFPNSVKNWGYTSAPVRNLRNASFDVDVADVVGGSSLHNGMVADRGSKADYDGWGILAGNDTWSWSGLYPYFVKSTNFTPPRGELSKEFNIRNNASAYGDGPIQLSYPSLIFPDLRNQTLAANAYGIATSSSPESGDAIGLYWIPQSVDYAKGTRSHARVAYYDPVAGRPNLHLVTGHLVEEILFSKDLTATGVRVNTLKNNKTSRISASREVILAAGAISTPKLLQLSGIGPKNILRAAGVKVKLDKPAVGANFQDHLYGTGVWNITNLAFPNDNTLATNTTYNASAWEEYVVNHTVNCPSDFITDNLPCRR